MLVLCVYNDINIVLILSSVGSCSESLYIYILYV